MTDKDDRGARVLFVDDERRVLTSMRAMFRRDYDVFLANSGEEAFEVLRHEAIDVIVSDQRMPGMTGVEVLKAFRDRAPYATRILLTGHADQDAISASINEGEAFRYLTKPCAPDLLKEAIGLAAQAAGSSGDLPTGAALDSVRQSAPAPANGASGETKAPNAPVPKVADEPSERAERRIDVELLLLSGDSELRQHLLSALGSSRVVHHAADIGEAVDALTMHNVGVFVTDMAIDPDDIQALTSQLKQHVPELVTVVASDHADAHRMIDLINNGQVYRFLLKPIKAGQTAIWVESAINKHLELMDNPERVSRHVVTPGDRSLRRLGEQIVSVMGRITRIRSRAAWVSAHD